MAKTGAWLKVQPSTVNGIELGAQEWSDALFLRYGIDTPDPPTYCDGCNAKLKISHALNCKRGGLVTARQNELRDRVADLAGKAFTPSNVRNDPLIFTGRAVKRMKDNSAGDSGTTYRDGDLLPGAMEQKQELLIHDLWKNRTDSVHDMCVVNTDAKYHSAKIPENCFQEAERGKKKIYLEA